MIKFGPSGNSQNFYAQGYKHTYQAMAWVKELGLDAYEYSFGRGARIRQETAVRIREEAEKSGITLSVHAPYYINLATDDPEKFEKNVTYFNETSRAARWFGAQKIVFHPGSPMKQDRRKAFEKVCRNFKKMLMLMDEAGFSDLVYCPETMGKVNQLGDLEEIIELVNIDKRVLPTIDFGHLHARDLGALNSRQDFENVISRLIRGIGREKTKQMHVHFSKIEYTSMGEKQHRTFHEQEYGPDFSMLAPVLVKESLCPTIVCESKGTMAEDALAMKQIYLDELKKKA